MRWVYRTSDTFILTRAMQNYLQSKQGSDADIYQFVVDEVYRPLGLGPGVFTTMRTPDNDWQGQAEGGYGQWWIPDDIAKIGTFLIRNHGEINGEQILHPDLLAASLQQDPDDRGVLIDSQRMYNNSFWANRYTTANGFDCEFWVSQMLGVSGNVVALFRICCRTPPESGRPRRRLAAVMEIAARIARDDLAGRDVIAQPEAATAFLMRLLAGETRVQMGALLLDAKNRLLRNAVVFSGGAAHAAVAPSPLFGQAILAGATGLVLWHNHPSGDPEPSPDDVAATARLAAAGREIGIEVRDHLIVGRGRWVSFLRKGRLSR